jgi:glycosyltransferase involved in cell wall biosynthesis
MRIGIDISAVRQTGGIGRYTRELLGALAKCDDDNEYRLLYLPAHKGDHPPIGLTLPAKAQVIRPPVTQVWTDRVWHHLGLPFPVEFFGLTADVFWGPDFRTPFTLTAKSLVTVHDVTFRFAQAFTPARTTRFLNKAVSRSVKRAKLVLADSASTRRDIIYSFGVADDRVRVLYPGVSKYFFRDPSSIDRTLIGSWLGIADAPYILWLSTSHRRKNVAAALEVFSEFKRHVPDANHRLAVCGVDMMADADLQEGLKRMSPSDASNVIVRRDVPEEQLPLLFSCASAFLYFSYGEGFGLPVAEALAAGAPTVVSHAPPLPEIVGDVAEVVNPADIRSAASALERAVMGLEIHKGRLQARRSRAAKFDWEKSALDLIAAFRSAAIR